MGPGSYPRVIRRRHPSILIADACRGNCAEGKIRVHRNSRKKSTKARAGLLRGPHSRRQPGKAQAFSLGARPARDHLPYGQRSGVGDCFPLVDTTISHGCANSFRIGTSNGVSLRCAFPSASKNARCVFYRKSRPWATTSETGGQTRIIRKIRKNTLGGGRESHVLLPGLRAVGLFSAWLGYAFRCHRISESKAQPRRAKARQIAPTAMAFQFFVARLSRGKRPA